MQNVGLWPAVAVVAGAWAGLSPHAVWVGAPVLPPLVLLAAAAWWGGHPRLTVAALAAGFAAAACVQAGTEARERFRPSIRALLDAEVGGFALGAIGPGGPHEPLPTRARLTEDAARSAEGATLRLSVVAVRVRGTWRAVEGGVTASIGAPAGVTADRLATWRAGRLIEAPMVFRRPARYLNAGVRDMEADLARGGLALFASVKSGLLVELRGRGGPADELAASVRARVRRAVARWTGAADATAGAIVTAVLIGDRGGISDEVRERLQAAGTYHVIAISGGNVAMLVAIVVLLLRAAGTGERAAAVASLVVLAVYGQVASAGPSVWRATVMAGLHLAARVLDQRASAWQAMAISGAGMLALHPLDLLDPGFQLTFGATAALLHATRWDAPAPRTLSWLRAGVVATLAVEVALAPVAAATFSRVTAAGLVLNLAAVPLMAVAQVAGIVTVAVDALGFNGAGPGLVARLAAEGLVESARVVDAAPWLAVRVPPPAGALVAAYYGACAVLVVGRGRVRAAAAVALAAALALIVTGARWPAYAPPGGMRMTLLDVGQGEAILVETAGGAVLVDAGGAPFGASSFDIGGRVIAPALWARGIRRLSVLAITHGDPDHIGGAQAVLRDFAPRELWLGVEVPGHEPTAALVRMARERGVRVVRRQAGDRVTMGRAALRVLHPPEPEWQRRRVRNDDSLVLEATVGDVAVLLTGDAGTPVEREVAARLTPARVRVLKAGHHGSRTATGDALVAAWRPQLVVLSCGRGNAFGHPAPEVVRRVEDAGAALLRTDRDGQVTVETDGVRLWTATYAGG